MHRKIATILLAAGTSSRLGEAKQLVRYKGKSLIRHAIEQSLALEIEKTICVLGHKHLIIKEEINAYPITTLINEKYNDGMGTSIALGINYLQKNHPEINQVLIMLVDQPLIPKNHYVQLIEESDDDTKLVVGTNYGTKNGVPAVFNQALFEHLDKLEGPNGAKEIINNLPKSQIKSVYVNEAQIDIDTKDDLQFIN